MPEKKNKNETLPRLKKKLNKETYRRTLVLLQIFFYYTRKDHRFDHIKIILKKILKRKTFSDSVSL